MPMSAPVMDEASKASPQQITTASAAGAQHQAGGPSASPPATAAGAGSAGALEQAQPSTSAAQAHTTGTLAAAQGTQVLIWKGFWSSKDCRQHRGYLFVFGDNDKRRGVGGQAVIRGEPNAIGISTKKEPTSRARTAYWTDAELQTNTAKIQADISAILSRLQSGQYTTLVMPENGVGTGLSKLPVKAPKTFQRLKSAVHKMLEDLQEGYSAKLKW